MLKERHRYGVRASSSSRAAPRRNLIAPPEVGIFPGNRFFLLPLKKVSALVCHHDYPCRGASATSIKTCIESNPGTNRAVTASNPVTHTNKTLRSSSSRPSIVRQRRRQPAIAKTLLVPISEQEEGTKPLLDDPGNGPWNQGTGHVARIRKQNLERAENARRINTHLYFRKAGRQEESRVASHRSAHVDVSTGLTSRTVVTNPTAGLSHNRRRAKGTSIFNLDQPLDDVMQNRGTRVVSKTRFSTEREFVSELVETALQHEGMVSGQRQGKGKKKVRNFGRNRVSPSEHPTEVVSEKSFVVGSVKDSFGRLEDLNKKFSVSRRVRCGDERDESFGGCSGVDQTRWSTWRSALVCSLENENDLPIGPLRASLKDLLLK